MKSVQKDKGKITKKERKRALDGQKCQKMCVCVYLNQSLTHLPVAEHELGTSQAAGALANLVGEAKALGHGQHGIDDEDLRSLLHLFAKNTTLTLGQHGVDTS